jgi:branched-chain amino acid transport system permease protein
MNILNYFLHLGIIFNIFLVLSLSFNFSLGFAGIFNLAVSGLALFGGYVSALLILKLNLSFEIVFVLTIISGYLIGVIISLSVRKLKGDYLALTTFGFSFIVMVLALNWQSLTRGSFGLIGIPKPKLFGFSLDSLIEIFIFYSFISIIVYLFLEKLKKSPLGRIIQAMRDDELALLSLGKNTFQLKSYVLGLSSLFAGLSGLMSAYYFSYFDPRSFGLNDLIFVLSAVLLGGLGSNKGTAYGVLLLILIPELLRFFALPSSLIGPLRQIIYAILVILILWLKPKGLFGKISLK